MNNSTSMKAMSMVIATSIFAGTLHPISIKQSPFEIHLSDSQVVKIALDVSLVNPYIRFMEEKAEEESKKRENERIAKEEEIARLEAEEKERERKMQEEVNSDIGSFYGNFELTAYNLSENSSEKSPSDPYFGIASSGYDFKGKDLRVRKIAVDPNVIEMGSTVYLEFPEEGNIVTLPDGTVFELSGYYQAVDVGGAIKGNIIDLFVGGLGSEINDLCYQIGRKYIKVYK